MTHTDAIRKINKMMDELEAIEHEFPEIIEITDEDTPDQFTEVWVRLERIRTNLRKAKIEA